MSEQSLKALKKAVKFAVIGQSTATNQKDATEGYANKIAIAVEQYIIEELKASGIVFEGGKLPDIVTRKGNLEGVATVALTTAQLAEEATNAISAVFAEASLVASSSLYASTAGAAATAMTALTASYVNLVAGPNITINTASNGNIEITGSSPLE